MNIQSLLVMGSPEFAVPTLQKLVDTFPASTITVFTQPDSPKGRGRQMEPTPMGKLAAQYKLATYKPLTKQEVLDRVTEINPDLIIIVAYGMIIPKAVTDRWTCINIHPSLLPLYRGPSPIQAALRAGDARTGVTLMRINEQMDSGDIIFQTRRELTEADCAGSLQDEFARTGAELVIQFIQKQWQTNSVTSIPQDHNAATYCSKLDKHDLLLDLTNPGECIAKIRAYAPKPGAYALVNTKRVVVTEAHLDNGHLVVTRVRPEGKPEMSYHDYCLGNPKGLFEC